jgi:hypothetical protein
MAEGLGYLALQAQSEFGNGSRSIKDIGSPRMEPIPGHAAELIGVNDDILRIRNEVFS